MKMTVMPVMVWRGFPTIEMSQVKHMVQVRVRVTFVGRIMVEDEGYAKG